MKIGSFYLSYSSKHYAWVGDVEVLDDELPPYNTPLSLRVQDKTFNLLIDGSSNERHFGYARGQCKVIGAPAIYAAPRAAKLTATSNNAMLASQLAAELTLNISWD